MSSNFLFYTGCHGCGVSSVRQLICWQIILIFSSLDFNVKVSLEQGSVDFLSVK